MAFPRFLFIAVVAVSAALRPLASEARPPLAADHNCPKPIVKAALDYPREQVVYDLERHPDFKRRGRPLGLFSAGHRIGYSGNIQGGCLRRLTVTIEVTPRIHLRAIYTKKSKKCARQLVLDHERRHGRVAKKEYQRLAADIKKLVVRLFAGKRVADVETAEAHLSEALDSRVLPQFRKRYDAAQDTFHGKLKQAEIVKKKCRLVKRKR